MVVGTVLEKLFLKCDWLGMAKRLNTSEGQWEAKQLDSRQELLIHKDQLYTCHDQVAKNVAKSLIYCYPDGLLEQRCKHRYPIFVALSQEADEEIIQAMLDVRPGCAVAWGESGSLPLHYAVAFCSNIRVIRLMLRAIPQEWFGLGKTSRRRSVKNFLGQSLLHLCVIYKGDELDLLRLIIGMFPEDVSVKDKTGQLPLHCACRGGIKRKESLELLLSAYPEGAKTEDQYGFLPLHAAVAQSPSNVAAFFVRRLIQLYPESVYHRDMISGQTPLYLACRQIEKLFLVPLLLQADLSINIHVAAQTQTLRGELPLHALCQMIRNLGEEVKVYNDHYVEKTLIHVIEAFPEGLEEPDPSTSGNVRQFPLGVISSSSYRPSGKFWRFVQSKCSKALIQLDTFGPSKASSPLSNRLLQVCNSAKAWKAEDEELRRILSDCMSPEGTLLQVTFDTLVSQTQLIKIRSITQQESAMLEEGCWFNKLVYCGCLFSSKDFNIILKHIMEHSKIEPALFLRKDVGGNMPMHMACMSPTPDSINAIINKVPGFSQDLDSRSFLVQALIDNIPHQVTIQSLQEQNAQGELPLHIILKNRHYINKYEIALSLVQYCPETTASKDTNNGLYPFMLAACGDFTLDKGDSSFSLATLSITYELLFYFLSMQNLIEL